LAKTIFNGLQLNDEREQTLNQLLTEMDGFKQDDDDIYYHCHGGEPRRRFGSALFSTHGSTNTRGISGLSGRAAIFGARPQDSVSAADDGGLEEPGHHGDNFSEPTRRSKQASAVGGAGRLYRGAAESAEHAVTHSPNENSPNNTTESVPVMDDNNNTNVGQ
jgi:hypothetical protein